MFVEQEPKKKAVSHCHHGESYVRKFSESVRFNMSLWYIGKMHVNG
jgi:hypothetical protein